MLFWCRVARALVRATVARPKRRHHFHFAESRRASSFRGGHFARRDNSIGSARTHIASHTNLLHRSPYVPLGKTNHSQAPLGYYRQHLSAHGSPGSMCSFFASTFNLPGKAAVNGHHKHTYQRIIPTLCISNQSVIWRLLGNGPVSRKLPPHR